MTDKEIPRGLISDDEYEQIQKLSEENAQAARKIIDIRCLHFIFGCPPDCNICGPFDEEYYA